MTAEIVHHHGIAGHQRRDEELFEIDAEFSSGISVFPALTIDRVPNQTRLLHHNRLEPVVFVPGDLPLDTLREAVVDDVAKEPEKRMRGRLVHAGSLGTRNGMERGSREHRAAVES